MYSICFITDYFFDERVGGAEVQSWNLAKEFARRGWNVDYMTQSLKGKDGQQEIRDNARIHWLKPRPLSGFTHFFKVYKILNTINPEICYQRVPSFFTGIVGYWCTKHNKLFIYACPENNSCVKDYFSRFLQEVLVSGQYTAPFYKRIILRVSAWIKDRLYYYGLYRADLILAQNSDQQDAFRKNLHLESALLVSGHEVPEFKLKNGSMKSEKPIIAWVGILGDRKQPHLFTKLAEKCIDLDCEFIMAGYGAAPFERNMREADVKLPNFRYVGPISFEESNELISRVFVVVNCSKPGREGFPNVFIQSWLCGVPVLSLHTNPDGVLNGKVCGICTNGDFELLEQELRRLLQHPQERHFLGHRTSAFAKKNYNIEKVVNRLIILLSTIKPS